MSDLSNLLGELYGDSSDPDGRPVRHEPPAAERSDWQVSRTDDDLAAALSAALADAPAPVAPPAPPAPASSPAAPAPSMPAVPSMPVMPSVAPAQAEMAYAPPAPAAPAPVAPVAPPVAAAPQAPAPAARAPWTAPAEQDVAPAITERVAPIAPSMWARGDDDIFPLSGSARRAKAKKSK